MISKHRGWGDLKTRGGGDLKYRVYDFISIMRTGDITHY